MHTLRIKNNRKMPFLQYLSNGVKKAEGRIATNTIKNLVVGETLKLQGNNEYVIVEIIFLHFYENFKEMLELEWLDNMLPFVNTMEEGIEIYSSFPGAERVHEMGCCAIGLKCVSQNLKFVLDD